jgi:hypothetical protein
MKLTKTQILEIAQHYIYAAAAAVSAAIIAGTTTPRDLGIAALAGAFGPLLAALNPKEVKFGIGYLPPEIASIVAEVVAKTDVKATKTAKTTPKK